MHFAIRNACNPKPTDNHFIRRANVYGDLRTLATIKGTEVFMWSARYFFLILSKFEFYGQNVLKVPNIKFRWNPSSGSRTDECGQTDMTKLMIAFRLRRTCLKTHFFGERVVLSFVWRDCDVWQNDVYEVINDVESQWS